MIASHHGIVAGPAQSHDDEPPSVPAAASMGHEDFNQCEPDRVGFLVLSQTAQPTGESVPPSTRACTATGSITASTPAPASNGLMFTICRLWTPRLAPMTRSGSRRLYRVDLPAKTGQQLEPGLFLPT